VLKIIKTKGSAREYAFDGEKRQVRSENLQKRRCLSSTKIRRGALADLQQKMPLRNQNGIRVQTPKAPEAIGPYSQAVISGEFIFCSGQIGLDPKTGKLVEGGIIAQAERAILNLKAVLEEAGSSLKNVVKTTVYLKNITDFHLMNEIYANHFLSKPARATVEVSALPKNALVEIECIASSKN